MIEVYASIQEFMSDHKIKHVAIIMDGNGRWAKSRGLPRLEGHRKGVENVRKVLDKARELNIQFMTLYAFSSENWNRPQNEVSGLMSLLKTFLKAERKNLVKKKVRLLTIGDTTKLPEAAQKELAKTKEATSAFTEHNLILALNYGSRQELESAVQKLAQKVKRGEIQPESIEYSSIESEFYTSQIPDPDLVIRTSGEHRLSNFLLLQTAYSEFYFTPIFWPDFNEIEFQKAIDSFSMRERRFGKTGEQIQQVAK